MELVQEFTLQAQDLKTIQHQKTESFQFLLQHHVRLLKDTSRHLNSQSHLNCFLSQLHKFQVSLKYFTLPLVYFTNSFYLQSFLINIKK